VVLEETFVHHGARPGFKETKIFPGYNRKRVDTKAVSQQAETNLRGKTYSAITERGVWKSPK